MENNSRHKGQKCLPSALSELWTLAVLGLVRKQRERRQPLAGRRLEMNADGQAARAGLLILEGTKRAEGQAGVRPAPLKACPCPHVCP